MTRRDDILALQKADPTITQSEIAVLLGVSRQTINNICRMHGIALNDGRVKRTEKITRIHLLEEIASLRADIERMQCDIEEIKAKVAR